ncbi:MAG: D-glycerate dehydrogenase [Ardenticatenaceae bacterium]|nr:D-glycerate dehydrogenase [Ardenticatenaceae bacterium]
MTQIIITRKIFDEAIALLDEAGLDYWHNEDDTPLSLPEMQVRVAEAESIISLLTDRIDAQVMNAAPHLKIIANVAVGYDNIDVAAATERGIIVTNTPGAMTECTADLAFVLILATARHIVAADAFMRAGKFEGWELFQPHLGVELVGKTLGIVGMGRIGTAVARRAALGFQMNVLYTASSPKPEAEQAFGVKHVSFSDLLRQSDFISVHTPLTPQTRHLFTIDEFRQMKPSAIFINTARGPIVKEADLVQALAQGLIAGAGLDVYEEEPIAHPGLAERPNVVMVPHIGSATTETRRRMAVMAAQNVVSVLSGKRPLNPVNRL